MSNNTVSPRTTSRTTLRRLVSATFAAGIAELGCETDFVAKTDDFQALAAEIAAVVAADAGLTSPTAALEAVRGGPADGTLTAGRRVSMVPGEASMLNSVRTTSSTTPIGTSLLESVNQGFSGSSETGAISR